MGVGYGWYPRDFVASRNSERKIGRLGRRIGIFGAAPALEDVAAFYFFSSYIPGLAGNAHHLLRARVVRFHLVVGDAPILNRMVFRQFLLAIPCNGLGIQLETVRLEPRVHRAPMFACAADAGARKKRAKLPDRKSASRSRLCRSVTVSCEASCIMCRRMK